MVQSQKEIRNERNLSTVLRYQIHSPEFPNIISFLNTTILAVQIYPQRKAEVFADENQAQINSLMELSYLASC